MRVWKSHVVTWKTASWPIVCGHNRSNMESIVQAVTCKSLPYRPLKYEIKVRPFRNFFFLFRNTNPFGSFDFRLIAHLYFFCSDYGMEPLIRCWVPQTNGKTAKKFCIIPCIPYTVEVRAWAKNSQESIVEGVWSSEKKTCQESWSLGNIDSTVWRKTPTWLNLKKVVASLNLLQQLPDGLIQNRRQ